MLIVPVKHLNLILSGGLRQTVDGRAIDEGICDVNGFHLFSCSLTKFDEVSICGFMSFFEECQEGGPRVDCDIIHRLAATLPLAPAAHSHSPPEPSIRGRAQTKTH